MFPSLHGSVYSSVPCTHVIDFNTCHKSRELTNKRIKSLDVYEQDVTLRMAPTTGVRQDGAATRPTCLQKW